MTQNFLRQLQSETKRNAKYTRWTSDKDQMMGKDNDIDFLMKSDILEPFPFQTGAIKSLGAPLANIFDKDDLKKPVKRVKRRTWKKPKGKPKRPLSAYNLFFQHERENLIKSLSKDGEKEKKENDSTTENNTKEARRRHRRTHGKIGFAQLARDISQKWKTLDAETLRGFEEKAIVEKKRYKKELEEWKKKTSNEKKADQNVKAEPSALEIASVYPNMPPSHAPSLMGQSSAGVGTSLGSHTYSTDTTQSMEVGTVSPVSSIPDVSTSGACTPIGLTDLIVRMSNFNARRLATRREHRRILDLTFSMCQPSSPSTAQDIVTNDDYETASSDRIKEEEPEEFDLFSDPIFEALDAKDVAM